MKRIDKQIRSGSCVAQSYITLFFCLGFFVTKPLAAREIPHVYLYTVEAHDVDVARFNGGEELRYLSARTAADLLSKGYAASLGQCVAISAEGSLVEGNRIRFDRTKIILNQPLPSGFAKSLEKAMCGEDAGARCYVEIQLEDHILSNYTLIASAADGKSESTRLTGFSNLPLQSPSCTTGLPASSINQLGRTKEASKLFKSLPDVTTIGLFYNDGPEQVFKASILGEMQKPNAAQAAPSRTGSGTVHN